MAKYLKQEDVIHKIQGQYPDLHYPSWYGSQIKEMSGIDIVYCKDCKHRRTDNCPMYFEEWIEIDEDGCPSLDDIHYDNTKEYGFCDRGEKLNDRRIGEKN